jgi:hypothetical protein
MKNIEHGEKGNGLYMDCAPPGCYNWNVVLLLQEVSTRMSQFNQEYYTNGISNRQQFDQMEQAFYNYCTMMRSPKLGAAPVVITVMEGVILTLIFVALGQSILTAVAISAPICAVFAFLFWLAYRIRAGASKRFDAYTAADGGMGLFSDFAMAQSFEADQFRLGRYYLFIKNGAVLRIDSINDIIRIAGRSGVGLSVSVKDEYGSMSLPLCRGHMLRSQAEIDLIRNEVMQRRSSV